MVAEVGVLKMERKKVVFMEGETLCGVLVGWSGL